ncbi:WD40 repeat-like protein [Gonapodya prolifera JEL478]|uniref:WD40 repeat-like protein n=1 Tax=Gonapodya prolifera (strain JEL478) TaxID=1344416 RepID=A0A138ZY59_GONPJ|nr:WD40 repeat-like protein [Gonapodya prolifera JEL478]|eukprot:KXS09401.1 WD40 repeat-like protein [Gonapodya prolifera JEL478]
MDPSSLAYQEEVARACGLALDKRILAFASEPPPSEHPTDLRSHWNRPLRPPVNPAARRKVATQPERVLDAPGLVDDYYLNLLDWSPNNTLAIVLGRTVYLWFAETGDVVEFCSVGADPSTSTATPTAGSPGDSVTSVSWTQDGAYLAVGTNEGDVQIWDVEQSKKVRSMPGHQARVGVLGWRDHLLSSGCRDGSIHHHDVRVANHRVAELTSHTSEVCGLKWRGDGAALASGGNDNLVHIWDARSSTPKFTKSEHNAAVKALDWAPWQLNLLATGGGTHDRHIHFWNSTTGAKLSSIDTGSQVTSLIWSRDYREILSAHGFPDNQLTLWSYPSLGKVVDLTGHDARVLHTAVSPDGMVVATAAGDECLKFWRVWERKKVDKSREADAHTSRPADKAAVSDDGLSSAFERKLKIR